MTTVMAPPSAGLKDRACVAERPGDCIDQGLPEDFTEYLHDNVRFFTYTRSGQGSALRSPGGARKPGPLTDDTAMVAALPPQGA